MRLFLRISSKNGDGIPLFETIFCLYNMDTKKNTTEGKGRL